MLNNDGQSLSNTANWLSRSHGEKEKGNHDENNKNNKKKTVGNARNLGNELGKTCEELHELNRLQPKLLTLTFLYDVTYL